MQKENKFDLFAPFDKDKCTLCGECFSQCPVMHLPIDEAKKEMGRLIAGEKTKYVLQKCTSCLACNLICPEHCNPTQLILDRWHEMYMHQGLPLRAKWFIPHYKPNFRTYVLDKLPEDEKKMLEAWNNLSPCEEMFYPGCNIITSPYLTRTSLLDGLEIRGSLDTCCGEMYYRMGLFEQVEQVAKRLDRYFRKLGVKRMIIPCTAGYNMFSNVLPRFGFKPDFEIRHLLPWLWERIEDGRIEIKSNLGMKVTIQDSCYGKIFGEKILDLPRKLLARIGVEVVEERYCRQESLCCGIAGGFSPESGYSPNRIVSSTIRSLREAKATRADAIVVYCAGCFQMLSTVHTFYPTGMPIYHILEMLQMTIGEKPARRQKQRGRAQLVGTLVHQSPKLISRNRFRVKQIAQEW
jgi:Fe-S oxidoreductase